MPDQNSIPPNLPVEDKKPAGSSLVPPPAAPKPVAPPAPVVIAPKAPEPLKSVMPLPTVIAPKASEPVKPAPFLSAPASPPTSKTPPVNQPTSSPMKSFIRTMGDDIKSAQAGVAPKGIEKQIPTAVPTSPQAPTSPSVSRPVGPVSEIKLGKPEQNSVVLPGNDAPKITISEPKLAPSVSLSTPKPLAPPPAAPKPPVVEVPKRDIVVPPKPVAPVVLPPKPAISAPVQPPKSPTVIPPAPPKTPPSSTGVIVPSGGSSSGNFFQNKKSLAIVAGALVAAGVAAWFFLIREPGDSGVVISPTPTASVSGTPSSSESGLSVFFGRAYDLTIETLSAKGLVPVLEDILDLNIGGNMKNILINPKDENGNDYTFGAFLERYLVEFPTNLLSALDGKDFDLIWSKQQEKFDVNGKLTSASSQESRVALITRVVNAQEVRSMMLNWEESSVSDLREMLGLPEEANPTSFSTSNYRDIAIRYANITYPDKALDYAIITATSNDDYLVIATSREQMYGIIDTFLGFVVPGK